MSKRNFGRDAIRGSWSKRSLRESFLDMPIGRLLLADPLFASPSILILLSTSESTLFSVKSWTVEGSFCKRQQRELTLAMSDFSSEAAVDWVSLRRYCLISCSISSHSNVFPKGGSADAICSLRHCPMWLTRSLMDIEGWIPGTIIWSQFCGILWPADSLLPLTSVMRLSITDKETLTITPSAMNQKSRNCKRHSHKKNRQTVVLFTEKFSKFRAIVDRSTNHYKF